MSSHPLVALVTLPLLGRAVCQACASPFGTLWRSDRRPFKRGNAAIAIPEIIEILDLLAGEALRVFLIDTLAARVKILAATQDADTGEWHTPIDDPTSCLASAAIVPTLWTLPAGLLLGASACS
jgi:hypothetical protein